MYFPIKVGRESFYSIVCECSIHLQLFISCIRENGYKTCTLYLHWIGRLCRVALKQAWNERKDLIQLLEVWIKGQYSICDIPDAILKLSYQMPLAFSYGGLSCLNVLNRISVKRSILRELIKICTVVIEKVRYYTILLSNKWPFLIIKLTTRAILLLKLTGLHTKLSNLYQRIQKTNLFSTYVLIYHHNL